MPRATNPMSDLLFEIGTEEIPAGYLGPAMEQLAEAVRSLLAQQRLPAETVRAVGTPRRLVVAAEGMPERQANVTEEVTGPPAKVAFDGDGKPTKAATGFAKAQGVPVESLTVKETPKGPYVVAVIERAGAAALDVLPELLRGAALSVTFPKSMRWPSPADEHSGVRFARPIRWVLALLDGEVVPVEIAGIKAGRTTYGHPFLAPRPIELEDADYDTYRTALKERRVLVDAGERRDAVREQVSRLLKPHGSELAPGDLLDEVANLVEWPHAVEGSFDERFLDVPACVVCAAMIEHQRYFPVRDPAGKLLNRFIIVSNRGPEQEDTVREGNEMVLRARLEDARFFWEEDRRTPLEERVPRLEGVVYLGGLGNNLQRTERLVALSARIAGMMGLSAEQTESVRRAAHLCKADLLTGLVGEFPSLQGMVGGELALHDGEAQAVAAAIAEHYRPESFFHQPPASAEGAALALADKLDVMVGCFALGHLPSGSQDPFALRRNALGVLLILEARQLALKLSDLVEAAREVLEQQADELATEELAVPKAQVIEFFRDRLYNAALERGHAHDLVRAVLSAGFDRPTAQEALNQNVGAFWARLAALAECARMPWWPALVELVDRTYRIQRDLDEISEVDEGLLEEKLERELGELLKKHAGNVASQFEAGHYVEGAQAYCEAFAGTVHDFFDKVFVNVDDEAVRRNRKSLCGAVYHLFADHFADLYLIETAEASGE